MAISDKDAERLNLISPAANEVGLGDIVQGLQDGTGSTIAIANVTGLQAALNAKLTATKAAAQANSTATDAAGIVTDFNALLAKLRTAGLLT